MSSVASVQTVHVGLEAIDEDILCLEGEQYRAVLEVGSINYSPRLQRRPAATEAM